MPTPNTATLLGLPFSTLGMDALQKKLSRHLETNTPLTVFTPNGEILTRVLRDPSLHRLLRKADLLLPDGVGVLLLSRALNRPVRERLPGIDVGERLLQYAARHRYPVYLFGGRAGVAERAAKELSRRFPGLWIVGTHHGYPSPREEEALLRSIERTAPQILFVCTGFPEQERWILSHRDRFPHALALGLGGALDVWSGDCLRAPKLLQELGVEWLWRVLCSPRRIPRLRFLFPFLLILLAAQKRAQRPKPLRPRSLSFRR